MTQLTIQKTGNMKGLCIFIGSTNKRLPLSFMRALDYQSEAELN